MCPEDVEVSHLGPSRFHHLCLSLFLVCICKLLLQEKFNCKYSTFLSSELFYQVIEHGGLWGPSNFQSAFQKCKWPGNPCTCSWYLR